MEEKIKAREDLERKAKEELEAVEAKAKEERKLAEKKYRETKKEILQQETSSAMLYDIVIDHSPHPIPLFRIPAEQQL